MIIDSDILIWCLRGNEKANQIIRASIPFSISVINYMEIVQGMQNKQEQRIFLRFLKNYSVNIIHIDERISGRAMLLVENYALSHGMMLTDALVAATTIEQGDTLLTGNHKHYSFIPNLQVEAASVR